MLPIAIHEEEAGHVRWLFERYSTGAVSLAQLASELNQRGVKPRYSSGYFTKSSVQSMIENATYAGYVTYRDEIERDGLHEAIIDPALWHRVQRVRDSRRRAHGKRGPKTRDYLLAGVGLHDECQTRLWGDNRHGVSYYRCPLQAKGIPHRCERTVSIAKPIDADLARFFERFHIPEEWADVVEVYIAEEERTVDRSAERERLERKMELAQRALLDGYVAEEQAKATIHAARLELAELQIEPENIYDLGARTLLPLVDNWPTFDHAMQSEAVRTIFSSVQVNLSTKQIGEFSVYNEFEPFVEAAENVRLVPAEGFEPSTWRLGVACSVP